VPVNLGRHEQLPPGGLDLDRLETRDLESDAAIAAGQARQGLGLGVPGGASSASARSKARRAQIFPERASQAEVGDQVAFGPILLTTFSTFSKQLAKSGQSKGRKSRIYSITSSA
jgi:hypothetical protein